MMVMMIMVMMTCLVSRAESNANPISSCLEKNCTTEKDYNGFYHFDCTYAACTHFPLGDSLRDKVNLIDLSHNVIQKIPELPPFPQLTTLNLAYNHITSVTGRAFRECQQLHVLNMTGNNMSFIPHDMFFYANRLQYIYLNGNKLEKINSTGIFAHSKNVKVVKLQNNRIEFIVAGAFDNARQIEILRLSYNRILQLHPGGFRDLGELTYLFLDHNQLTSLPGDIFTDLASLAVLDISHNRIEHVSQSTFDSMKELKILYFSNNPLKHIYEWTLTALAGMEAVYVDNTDLVAISPGAFPANLRTIRISNTSFMSEITNGTFTGLPRLEKIAIEGNPKLSVIEAGAFDGRNSSVRDVLLGNNALTALSEDLLDWDQVRELDLRGNSWDCSCHIAWMLRTFSRKQCEQVVCITPSAQGGPATLNSFKSVCGDTGNRKIMIIASLASSVFCVCIITVIVVRCWRRIVMAATHPGQGYRDPHEVVCSEEDSVLDSLVD